MYSYELPIARRARHMNWDVRHITDAKSFCAALCRDKSKEAYGFTLEDWENITAVASGEMWPVPARPYTRDDWQKEGDFSAVPGQEITEDIYEHMFDILPPYRLPRCKRTEGYNAGFLVSEPAASDLNTGELLYNAFGKIGKKYYYIGILPTHPAE